MKLHLREVWIGRTVYRVLTLRPGTVAAFSTNYFHGTWHIVSDPPGARLLAHLFWGLAYQKQPGTLFLIHGDHIRPTPFDADPSDPILLIPAHLTRFHSDHLRQLKLRLPHLGAPERTVRWQTHGLDHALSTQQWYQEDACKAWRLRQEARGPWSHEHATRAGGFLCYTAPPSVLRHRAFNIHRMSEERSAMTYEYLAEGRGHHYGEGEVQIFPDYSRQLSDAAVARREVLAASRDRLDPETLRERVWARTGHVAGRRRARKGVER
jgi:hypothetical protein